MSLSNCPPDFHLNCKNYIYKCKLCKAGHGSSNLFYQPIDKEPCKSKHPAYTTKIKPPIDKTKSKQVKGGYKAEKTLTNKIAKQTLRSGAILHDGDISLFEGDLKLDSKVRYNKQSFAVSKAEYLKGKTQHLDGWILTNKSDNSEETVVVLTLESFTQLLAYKLNHE
jgi:hypothetical protein